MHLHLILGDEYNYLVDTGLGSASVEPVKAYLSGTDRPLVIINTHHHWDHVWGNGAFASPLIVAHTLCHSILLGEWDRMLAQNGRYVFGQVKKQLPTLLFDRELYFPEDRIRLLHTPGHTPDSVSVLDEKEGVLNVGDNIGDTLAELLPSLDCDRAAYAATLALYGRLSFDTCVSGHNTALTRETLLGVTRLL